MISANEMASGTSEAAGLLRKTPDEEHRVRAGADGAQLEVWRRVATILIPQPALGALVAAAEAERAQLRLPLDSTWADEDTLPFVVLTGGGR